MDYYHARCAEVAPLFAFGASDLAEARAWRVRAQSKARDLLGESPELVPLNAETLDVADLGRYVREKVVFDSDPHSSIPAYVLIPKGLSSPAPALVCLHDHETDKEALVGIDTPAGSDSAGAARALIERENCDFARQFAQRGYVTIAIDLRCFGERADPSVLPGRDACSAHFICGCILGTYPLTLNLHDVGIAIDYLLTRPEADHERIGCIGLGLGGTVALWAAGMDKRVKAAVAGSCLCELHDPSVRIPRLCGSLAVPDLCRYFDICDVAALAAPRPLLVQTGRHDESVPVESAMKAYERLKAAYEAWGCPQAVALDVFAGGREFHTQTAVEWMDRWLRDK